MKPLLEICKFSARTTSLSFFSPAAFLRRKWDAREKNSHHFLSKNLSTFDVYLLENIFEQMHRLRFSLPPAKVLSAFFHTPVVRDSIKLYLGKCASTTTKIVSTLPRWSPGRQTETCGMPRGVGKSEDNSLPAHYPLPQIPKTINTQDTNYLRDPKIRKERHIPYPWAGKGMAPLECSGSGFDLACIIGRN